MLTQHLSLVRRGVAISAVVLRDLPVHEYAARQIKLAVVGRGGADKQQIQHMVGVMLNLQGRLQSDAADALAVAITHAHVSATAQHLGVSTKQAWSRKMIKGLWVVFGLPIRAATCDEHTAFCREHHV